MSKLTGKVAIGTGASKGDWRRGYGGGGELFLASPESQRMTGEILVASGGLQ